MKTPMHTWQRSLKYVTLLRLPMYQMKLLGSAFSLAGEAKRWLHSFKGDSLKTWEEIVEKFLKISSQSPRKTPTHGFSEPIQLNMFIDGLRPQTKQLLDASAGGKIKLKTPGEATELIENMSASDHANL